MPPSSEQVLEALHAFAEAMMVHRRQHDGHIDSVRRWHFERSANRSLSMGEIDPVLRVEWSMRESDLWLSSVPGYSALEAMLFGVPNIVAATKHRVRGPDPAKARKVALQCFIRDYLADVCEPDSFAVSETRKSLANLHLGRLIEDAVVEHRLQVFLLDLKVAETIDLDGLALRTPTDDELQRLFNLQAHDGPFEAAIACSAVIDGTETARLGEESILDARATAVVRGLRVWTGSRVCRVVSQTSVGRVDLANTRMYEAAHRPFPYLVGASPPAEVTQSFGTFWRRTRDVLVRPPSALDVALRRVDTMVDQARWDDRVLDLCIILEALFQLGDEKMELSYRLSLRTAHFVGTNKASRQATFDTVRSGYDLRSRIAHGDQPSGGDREKQEKLETVVFDALRKYCERAANFTANEAHKVIVRELDGCLLERGGD